MASRFLAEKGIFAKWKQKLHFYNVTGILENKGYTNLILKRGGDT
jgi:hypothetical protein